MKSPFLKVGLRFVVFQLGLLVCQTASAAVNFTVTPSSVSNTYSGPITLQVTGLAAGDTVVVQKYIDANTDGVIDAGDLLFQQFELTDGQGGMVIGGVTNINVPGDTDTVAGQITAKLNFQPDFLQTIAGKYLFKLSSPAGHFTAMTNGFTVTSYAYGQEFTGTVATNSVAVPYAAVLLFQFTGGNDMNPVAGAVANSAGSYTIPAPPGTYLLTAIKSNFVGSTAAAANLVLSSGATFKTNLSLISATQSVSGRLYDTNNSSIGLPGLLVSLQTTNGLLGIGFTDTNGNFAAGVNANQWKVGTESAGLAFLGYVGLQNKVEASTTGGSVANFNIGLPKATALFYGTVKDSFGNPLPGEVAIYAEDQNVTNNYNGTYQSDGYADTNGNFVTGVVGSSDTNDVWNVSIDNASSFPNYDFSQPSFDQNGGTNMAVGEVVFANFTAILATNHITGNVEFDGSPVSNLQVNANSQDTNNFQAQATTDSDGNYSMNVGNATWNVSPNCQGGNNSLDGILGGGNYQCPCSVTVNINNSNGVANFIVSATGSSGGIFGYVTNTSGAPIAGVNVYANSTGCNGNGYTTTTAGNGYYSFGGLANGGWAVSVDCGGLNSLGYQCPSSQNVTVTSDNVQQDFTVQSSSSSSGPLEITTSGLPGVLASNYYNQQLNASGGQPPYTWSLTPGSQPLPAGINLSTNGVISGMAGASAIGTNYFSVRVTDSQANQVDQFLSVTVYPALTIDTSALPNGTLNTPYSAEILVSGGDPFFSGSSPVGYNPFISSGSLPPGLGFYDGAVTSSNEYFVISGTPTNIGMFSWTGGVTDAGGNQAERNFSITITGSSLQKPSLEAAAKSGAQFQFLLNGAIGQNYTVQKSTNLGSTNWIALFVTNNVTTNSFLVIDPKATNGRGFYRIVVGP